MANELTDFDYSVAERPVFLKVLCILTFIYSTFTILTNFVNVVNPEKAASIISNSQTKIRDSLKNNRRNIKDSNANFSKKVMVTLSGFSADKIRKSAIGNIVTSLLCILGALLMWKLRRVGYYIYMAGIIVSVAVPVYLFGNNIIGTFMIASAAFFGLIFIIFYGMNFKSMVK